MPHFDADQWSVLLITVIFGAARLIVAAFAVRPLMSGLGHSRQFDGAPITSALPLRTDIGSIGLHVSKVPEAAISRRLISRCIKGGIDLITICPVSWRQRELKQSTLWLVLARPQPSAVFFDDGAADRQSHAHAAGFCREEWLEQ
jgi:hypothetical protein